MVFTIYSSDTYDEDIWNGLVLVTFMNRMNEKSFKIKGFFFISINTFQKWELSCGSNCARLKEISMTIGFHVRYQKP